jgi:KDO2-lipid IV(A) lauroyltransferase
MRHTAWFFYTFFRYFDDPAAQQRMIELTPQMSELIRKIQSAERGLVIAGIHLSNFDLAIQYFCQVIRKGFAAAPPLLALTLPFSTEAGEWQNDLRRRSGMQVIPTTPSFLRMAQGHLKSGGSILTGIDHPIADSTHLPRFFNRQAQLPLHHISLALKSQAPVVVVAAVLQPNGKYLLQATSEIEMQPGKNSHAALVSNGEQVLEAAAGFIRQAPTQWSIFQPVWPATKPLQAG